MKPKLLVFLAASLITGLLAAPEAISGGFEQTHYRNANGLEVPSYLAVVPPGHFTGISAPSECLAKARKSAISDVVRQILGAIGAKYSHHYLDEVYGNAKNPHRTIDDKLSGTAHGIVLDVQSSIVKSSWLTDIAGKYVYFVLVHYPEHKIQQMRRLTKGAKVIAAVVSKNENYADLKVSELNGVSAVISSAQLTVTQKNRFAKIITLFFWQVPSERKYKASIPITPLKLCNNTKKIRLPLKKSDKALGNYLLGTKIKSTVVLSGNDETGRHIKTKITF